MHLWVPCFLSARFLQHVRDYAEFLQVLLIFVVSGSLLACVASVSVGFESKELQREKWSE